MENLDKSYINKFKEAYNKDYGEALSDKDAYNLFFRLVRLVSTVLYGAPQYFSEPERNNPVDIDESNFIVNLKD